PYFCYPISQLTSLAAWSLVPHSKLPLSSLAFLPSRPSPVSLYPPPEQTNNTSPFLAAGPQIQAIPRYAIHPALPLIPPPSSPY
ncbi:hypothetical protein COCMIDRAFT_101734, partial [Bipolaris oryzae ATCC 44560]